MSICIPAIDGLTIGSLIPAHVMRIYYEINSLEQDISHAMSELNDLITLKKSLILLNLELQGISVEQVTLAHQNSTENKVSLSAIEEDIKEVEQKIIESTKNFVKVRIEASKKIFQFKKNLREQHYQDINVVDLNSTQIISKPLYYNSLKMDGRCFPGRANFNYDKIKDFIRKSVSNFYTDININRLTDSVINGIETHENNFLTEGIMMIIAACTHLYASTYDSLKIDTDKAFAAWDSLNHSHAADEEGAISESLEEVTKEKFLEVVTRVNYGSSFIGIVYILKNNESTVNFNSLNINTDISSIETLLKSKKINYHINLVVHGSIPNFAENNSDESFDIGNLIRAFNSFIGNARENKTNNGIPISLHISKLPLNEIVT